MNGSLKILAGCALGLLVTAARPAALVPATPGQWEISRSGQAPTRMCIAEPELLAQLEHRSQACNRTLVRDGPTTATIHYTCAGGGYGQSTITTITPRSLRIHTQGISGSLPFHYVVQARRVGDCPAH